MVEMEYFKIDVKISTDETAQLFNDNLLHGPLI